jgi:hypothetical protein
VKADSALGRFRLEVGCCFANFHWILSSLFWSENILFKSIDGSQQRRAVLVLLDSGSFSKPRPSSVDANAPTVPLA